jgi:hypothetical protein
MTEPSEIELKSSMVSARIASFVLAEEHGALRVETGGGHHALQ